MIQGTVAVRARRQGVNFGRYGRRSLLHHVGLGVLRQEVAPVPHAHECRGLRQTGGLDLTACLHECALRVRRQGPFLHLVVGGAR